MGTRRRAGWVIVLGVASACGSFVEGLGDSGTDTDATTSSSSGIDDSSSGVAETSTGSSTSGSSSGPESTVTTQTPTSDTGDPTSTTGMGSSDSGAESSSSSSGERCADGCQTGWDCIDNTCVNPSDGTPCPSGTSDCDVMAPFCAPDGLCNDGSPGDACFNNQCGVGLLCNSTVGCQYGDENDPCTFGQPHCGPLAPFCGPDSMCHNGDDGDACYENSCAVGFQCNPGGACQDGDEGDPCTFGQGDCGPLAPFCSPDLMCHNGDEGDSCYENSCAAGFRCNPSGLCQDGDEGDPCTFGQNDCGPLAPFCGPDTMCHDGDAGDPCYSAGCEEGLTCEGSVCA